MPIITKPLPAQAHLLECFDYDPQTGALTWLRRPDCHFSTKRGATDFNRRFAGKVAGSIGKRGYRIVVLCRSWWKAHRIIWKMMTGEDPVEIDHDDGDFSNNKWGNLNESDRVRNTRNTPLRKNNKSGVMGVYWSGRYGGRWIATIGKKEIGSFMALADAAAARGKAEREAGYHPNHGRRA